MMRSCGYLCLVITLILCLTCPLTVHADSSVTINNTSLTFPDTTVGLGSSSQMVTLFNNSSVGITVAPSVSGDYVLSGNGCTGTIAPGGTQCNVWVRFTPTTAGDRTGVLTVNYSGAATPLAVALDGTGVAQVILGATSISYPDTNLGASSSSQTISILNRTGLPITVVPTVTGNFAITSNNCPASMPANNGCTLWINFSPTTAGAAVGNLNITAGGISQDVGLSGNGVGSITLNKTAMVFDPLTVDQGSTSQMVTLYNNSGAGITVSPSITGDFIVSANGCTGTVAAGGTQCNIWVRFTPTTAGDLSGTLTINANGNPVGTVSLSGTGVGSITLNQTAFVFAPLTVGQGSSSQMVTLFNNSGAGITVSPSITGDFIVSANGCTGTIPAGGTQCNIWVRFTPHSAGALGGSLTINANGNPVGTVSLSGTGTAKVEVNPTALNFVPTFIGNSSGAQMVSVANKSIVPITITSSLSGPFSISTDGCSGTIAPNSGCNLWVNYQPSAAGTQTGTLTITPPAGDPQTVSLAAAGMTPVLELRIDDTPASVNLSDPINLDWIIWGAGGSSTAATRKTGITPLLGDLSILNAPDASADTEGFIKYSWTDGSSPANTGTDLRAEVLVDREDSGYQITVPADTTARTLKIYAGVYGTAKLEVAMSDGSVSAISDSSVSTESELDKTYLIDFRAGSTGQTLTVKLTLLDTAGGKGWLTLQAAALLPHLPQVAITAPSDGSSADAGTNLTVSADATQVDTTVSAVSIKANSADLFTMTAAPYATAWPGVAAGHYQLAANATDIAGLQGQSKPVDIDVIGNGGSLSVSSDYYNYWPQIYLSQEGTLDWVLWGWDSDDDHTPVHRKADVDPLIGDVKIIGNHPLWNSSCCAPYPFSFWYGTPEADRSNQIVPAAGVDGLGNGVELTVQADTTPRTLYLYAGPSSGRAKLTAFLSDGSAKAVTDDSVDQDSDNTGSYYAITFQAGSANQTLTVRLTLEDEYDNGSINLYAATLTDVPQYLAPRIDSISANIANPEDLGNYEKQITIQGSGFGDNFGNVMIGSSYAWPTSWSNDEIQIIVPPSTCSGPLTVIAGGRTSNSLPLVVVPQDLAVVSAPGLIGVGDRFQLTTTSGCGTMAGMTWSLGSTSSAGVATLSGDTLTAQAPGTVTLVGSIGTFSGSTTVNIIPERFSIIPGSTAIAAGSSVQLQAVGDSSGAILSGVTWQVTDGGGPNVGALSSGDQPTVTALNPGTLTIQASLNGLSDTAQITVLPVSTTDTPSMGTQPTTREQTFSLTDSLGNVTTYTSASIGGHRYMMGSQGPGCSSCSTRGNVQYGYDDKGNQTSITDVLGHVTYFTYDADGNAASRSYTLDGGTLATYKYAYGSFGNVLQQTDPMGNTTRYGYDDKGNLLTITSPAPDSNTPPSVTRFTYDPKGELIQITDPLGQATKMTYTAVGMVETITDPQQHVTSFEYDVRGNRTAVVDAMQHRTEYEYDIENNLLSVKYVDGTKTLYGYDNSNRRTSVVDPNGRTTTYVYDDADRLTDVADAENHTTHYTYDTENNLLSITDAKGQPTQFAYDAYGRVQTTTFPSNLAEDYVYDAIGNLTGKTDRKNQTISYVYDALNRLTHKGFPDSTGVDYVYDLLGRLIQVTDPTGTYGSAYDNLSRVTSTTAQYSVLPGQTFTNMYVYNAASNLTSFAGADGGSNTYVYDTLNRLTDVTNSWAGHFTFGYDQLSRRTQMTRPNGITTNYQYDSLSRLLSVLHQAGTTIDGASYVLDFAGNRTSKTNWLTGITDTYAYDKIYQLTQTTPNSNNATPESYSYDAVGNRLSSLLSASNQYDSSNHLAQTATASYSYDNNGNTQTVTASGQNPRGYTWDFENRLTQVATPDGKVISFKYDPFGRRIQKSSPDGSTTYLYDGANVIAELNAAGAVTARYAQGAGIDEPLAMQREGQVYYYQADGLGSITSLTNAAGAVSATYAYDTFGNLKNSSGDVVNSFRYTGREWDQETGLYYYRARYYDPQMGRFISEDPARSTSNFYPYVRNNPIVRTDPFGLWDTYTHHALLWNALRGCGVSNSDIWQLQQASDFVDAFMATDSAKHAMRDPGQNPADALANTDKWIQDNLNQAQQMYQQYGDTTSMSNPTSNYTTPLGNALHTIMDSTSPMHRHNGVPLPFPGSNALHHGGPSNPFGSGETWANMTPELMQQNIHMIQQAYEQVTGHKCGCDQQ